MTFSNDPTDPVLITPDDPPDDSWPFDRLMAFGSAAVAESGRLSTEATCLSRRSTIQIYRAGRSLTFARHKLPPGQTWSACLKAHEIPRTSAWEAMQLFERAGSEEAVAELSPNEAKHKYEITRPKSSDKDDDSQPQTILPFSMPPGVAKRACTTEGNAPLDEGDRVDGAYNDDAEDGDAVETDFEFVGEDSEPPEDETESVLDLLVKVNSILALAVAIRVAEKDRARVEAELHEAHRMLDEIDAI